MTRSSKTRIYFQVAGGLRAFYWVGIGDDGNAYYGSSVKNFKRSHHSSMKILEGETGTLDPGNLDGMQPTRLGGKHSIHPSGVILGKSLEAGGRIQHETPPLAHYHGHIPLVGLLPTNPESYPESAKVPREHDVVIAESPFGARPFAIAIFLTRKGEAEPEDAFVSRGPENARIWTVDRGEFLVSVAVYTNVETFVSWPVSQVELITRLSNEGGELAFPILRGAPKVAT